MFRSLATAASGMEAQQTKLDVTANNIANVSTSGFKKARAEFADLMYQTMRPAGAATRHAARGGASSRDTDQGAPHRTSTELDSATERKGNIPGPLTRT